MWTFEEEFINPMGPKILNCSHGFLKTHLPTGVKTMRGVWEGMELKNGLAITFDYGDDQWNA